MNFQQTLRTTMLVFLIVVLIYVLYRRLLLILRRNSISHDYATIENSMSWPHEKTARIAVELKSETNVRVDIYHASGILKEHLVEQKLSQGMHHFDLDTAQYDRGRYYYQVVTDRQKESQYFDIV